MGEETQTRPAYGRVACRPAGHGSATAPVACMDTWWVVTDVTKRLRTEDEIITNTKFCVIRAGSYCSIIDATKRHWRRPTPHTEFHKRQSDGVTHPDEASAMSLTRVLHLEKWAYALRLCGRPVLVDAYMVRLSGARSRAERLTRIGAYGRERNARGCRMLELLLEKTLAPTQIGDCREQPQPLLLVEAHDRLDGGLGAHAPFEVGAARVHKVHL